VLKTLRGNLTGTVEAFAKLGLFVGADVLSDGYCFDSSFNLLAEGDKIFNRNDLANFLKTGTNFQDLFKLTRYSDAFLDALTWLKNDDRLDLKDCSNYAEAVEKYASRLVKTTSGHYGAIHSTVGDVDLYAVAMKYGVAISIFNILPKSTKFGLDQFFYDNKKKKFQSVFIDIDDGTTMDSLLGTVKSFKDLCNAADPEGTIKHMAFAYNGYHFQPLPPIPKKMDVSTARVVGYGGRKSNRGEKSRSEKMILKDTVVVRTTRDNGKIVFHKFTAEPYRTETFIIEFFLRRLYPDQFPATFLTRSEAVLLPSTCEKLHPPVDKNAALCLSMEQHPKKPLSSLANVYKGEVITPKNLQTASRNLFYAAQELASLNEPSNNHKNTVTTHNDVGFANIVVPEDGDEFEPKAEESFHDKRRINSIIDLSSSICLRFTQNSTVEKATLEMVHGAHSASRADALNTFRRVTFVRVENLFDLPPYSGKIYTRFPFLYSGPHADLGAVLMLLVWFIAAYAESDEPQNVKQSKMLLYYGGKDGMEARFKKDNTISDAHRQEFHSFFLLGVAPNPNSAASVVLPSAVVSARSNYFSFLGEKLNSLKNLFDILLEQEKRWLNNYTLGSDGRITRALYPNFDYFDTFIKDFGALVDYLGKRIPTWETYKKDKIQKPKAAAPNAAARKKRKT